MYQINTPCAACGTLTVVVNKYAGRYWIGCTSCNWETVAVATGDNAIVADVNHEDPWSSVTPELKEVPFD